jgi:hypothetical protein
MPLLSRRRRLQAYACHTRQPPTGVLAFTSTDVTQTFHQGGDGLVFPGVNIGQGQPDRYVVVALVISANLTLTSVRAGSIELTRAVALPGIGFQFSAQVWFGKVPLDVVTDITVTSGGFIQSVSIAVGTLAGFDNIVVGATQTVPFVAAPDPHAISAPVGPGDVAVISCGIDRNMASDPVWTNATGDARINETGQNAYGHLTAHGNSSNPSFTGAPGFGVGMAMAVFAGAP